MKKIIISLLLLLPLLVNGQIKIEKFDYAKTEFNFNKDSLKKTIFINACYNKSIMPYTITIYINDSTSLIIEGILNQAIIKRNKFNVVFQK